VDSERAHRPVRPILLALVFGALLVVIGATAAGQSALVSSQTQTSLLNATVNADAALVRAFVDFTGLTPGDLDPATPRDPARTRTLDRGLEVLIERGEILAASVLTPDGRVLASSDRSSVGETLPVTPGLRTAVRSEAVDAAITSAGTAGSLSPLDTTEVLRSYFPVILDGDVRGVVAVWRDAAPILAQLETQRLQVVLITLAAAVISAVLLYYIFRAAQQRMSRQTVQLLESARLDPQTSALNHGAIVEALTLAIDATDGSGSVAVALVDIDNFGLLNDTYGHPAGDHALAEVARLLGRVLPTGVAWGRYGADEFLIVATGPAVATLETTLEAVRTELADLALTFQASERLPVTLSVGLCFYPTNGESVTTLLSVLAMTLDEAKASGGDAIRVADARPPAPSYAKTFDVLQGLVIAVDTKDRYTRRHSEDVARYADFIAELMGLDRETRQALHTAGLLHDVGKVGIPDVILRKPGKLTDDEFAIVKQHVALGDMIVRDLPNIDLIRAGIRHHHERWDGDGYLHGLAGEEIPLIARILAVGDAFSAMTTTRPYRKALSVDEALRRLEDAAGTQLDEAIALRFVEGIRTAADPPLPERKATPRRRSPDMQVA
jgi:diguanylate cyclase (GGDEF)-like protein